MVSRRAIVFIFAVDKLAYFLYNVVIKTVRYEKRSRDRCRLILRRMGERDMDIQNFMSAAIAFAMGSFAGSAAFYQILPEIRDIKKEKSVGSVLTCLIWIIVIIAGVIFAFKFSTEAGAFAIAGIVSGIMTSCKVSA